MSENDHPTVDSALNGDEPASAQETSLQVEPNGSEESRAIESSEPEPEASAPEPEASAPEPEASAPEPGGASEAPEPEEALAAPAEPETPPEIETPAEPEQPGVAAPIEEESSDIAAEIEQALQAAAKEPVEEEAPPVPTESAEPAPPVVVEPSSNGEVVVEAEAGEGDEEEIPLRAFLPGDWFVVHTYAGYENKVKTNLESRISSMNVEEKIFEVVIPMEDVMEIKSGKKQVVQRKVFPGYLLVRMDLDDDSWYVVRNTPGVTGFVGSGARPIPLSEKEVDRILQRKPIGERPKPKLEWAVNDPVRVTTGPFANFQGLISEIDTDRSKLKVLVNIFGRETPVELGFDQVAKV